jgi:hypothetical protein
LNLQFENFGGDFGNEHPQLKLSGGFDGAAT